MKAAKAVYWTSHAPTNCDLCGEALASVFNDANTGQGWAIMCSPCMQRRQAYGVSKLGTGLGQRYTKQPDGQWLKTGG